MLKLINLSKIYGNKSEVIKATDNINFEFKENGFYVILGKSGCGKTTLLNILAGLDKYDDGHIYIDKSDIGVYSEGMLDQYRNIRVGIIFQQYNLITDLNVFDNLRIALDIQEWDKNENDYDPYVKILISDILESVGLQGYEKRKIAELSGGEQQRVAIARTLLKQPDIILADEPTGNLDATNSTVILQILRKISEKKLVVMVSHDVNAAYEYADYIINMKDGTIRSTEENSDNEVYYSFFVCCDDCDEKESFELSERDTLNMLREKLRENNEFINLTKINRIERKKNNKDDEDIVYNERKNIRVKKLRNKYKLILSAKFLRKRKMRLLFTTFVFTLTAVLMYFSGYVSFYHKNDVIEEYMDKYNPKLLPVFSESTYMDDFFYEQTDTFNKGKLLYNRVKVNLENSADLAKAVCEKEVLSEDEKGFYNATIIYINRKEDCPPVISGKKINNSFEAVITDYIAQQLNVKEGDCVECGSKKYTICGIIGTDYIKYDLKNKLSYGFADDFFEYKCLYKYYTVYLMGDVLESEKERSNHLSLRASDFCSQKREDIYTTSFVTYSTSNNLMKSDLLCGAMPVAENEVVVSEDYAKENNITERDLSKKKFLYYDIYKKKYNGYYSQYLNMYDYFKDGVVITGILKNSNEEIQAQVYMDKEKWRQLRNDYFDYYYADSIIIPNKNKYKSLLLNASDSNIGFLEPGINKICEFDKLIINIKPVLFIILVIVVCINFILIGTFIGISIIENKRNIGILRSLGISMNTCVQIFNIEFIIIYLMSMALGGVGICIITDVVNEFYRANLHDVKFNIITISNVGLIIVAVVEGIVSMISAKIPIRSLKKKKTIEIIK